MNPKDEAKRKKKYDEDEHYRKYVEAMILKDPNDSSLLYTVALYRIGHARRGGNYTLLFPVKILKARKSFGKLQCLITPLLPGDVRFRTASFLGERWIDRKFLLLQHDHEYKIYEKYLPKDA